MKRIFVLLVTSLVTAQLAFTHLNIATADSKIPFLPPIFPKEAVSFSKEELQQPAILQHAQLKTPPGIVLASEIAGRIKKVPLRDGQHFKAGQILVSFSCPREETLLAEARVQLKIQLQLSQQFTAMHSVNELEISLATIEQAEVEAKVLVAEAFVNRCVLRAPFTGKLVKKWVKFTQSVRVGDPLLEVVNEDDREVELLVPATQLQTIKLGQLYRVNVENMAKSYNIELTGLGGRINPENKTIKVYGRLENPSSAALPRPDNLVALVSPAK